MSKKIFCIAFILTALQWPAMVCSKEKISPVVDTMQVKQVLQSISQKILTLTNYEFKDRANGQIYKSLQDIPVGTSVKLASDFNEWEYQNSLVCFGMNRVGTLFKTDDIQHYSTRKINFLADNISFFSQQQQVGIKTPYPLYFSMKELWYCGLAANVVDLYAQTKDERLKPFIEKFKNHIFNVQARWTDKSLIRIDNGRKVVQSDDAYMAVIFLVRMRKLTNEQRYLDEAVNQICS